jgi:hypothetical protein
LQEPLPVNQIGVRPLARAYKDFHTVCKLEIDVKSVLSPLTNEKARTIIEGALLPPRFENQQIVVRQVLSVEVVPEQPAR